ncbi:helix-turn-helix domain-containing protein [Paenibacillus sp. JDR-2]|uniref:response regulator transcription factor n=1 Tax=Paenibacillus sp. (strain JDR-2) TaxID=324057 RepID=UPI0001663DF3|nr:helix-turn-helix domain-containing protein [Paenibacillus sp. JDR-2]ACT02878.1 two component transcriptional regulator, AraC family [Paenibacillus sp. JDR-2]
MYKALLVQPDKISREETRLLLPWEQHGFQLHAYADSLSDAQALLGTRMFDLILIDLKPSQAAGMKLCEQIRELSRVSIILLGGSHDFQLLRKAMAFQVSDYIADPVQPEDLAASLCKVKKELDLQSVHSKRLTLSYENKRSRNPSIIDLVKQYVQEHMHENITLKKISNMLHFNCAYLGQKFKDQENMSFNEYLLQQRMEKSKLLLKKTDMRIYEIANEVGYTEIDWFYKKFKEYTGASANEYRKQSTIYAY